MFGHELLINKQAHFFFLIQARNADPSVIIKNKGGALTPSDVQLGMYDIANNMHNLWYIYAHANMYSSVPICMYLALYI